MVPPGWVDCRIPSRRTPGASLARTSSSSGSSHHSSWLANSIRSWRSRRLTRSKSGSCLSAFTEAFGVIFVTSASRWIANSDQSAGYHGSRSCADLAPRGHRGAPLGEDRDPDVPRILHALFRLPKYGAGRKGASLYSTCALVQILGGSRRRSPARRPPGHLEAVSGSSSKPDAMPRGRRVGVRRPGGLREVVGWELGDARRCRRTSGANLRRRAPRVVARYGAWRGSSPGPALPVLTPFLILSPPALQAW